MLKKGEKHIWNKNFWR